MILSIPHTVSTKMPTQLAHSGHLLTCCPLFFILKVVLSSELDSSSGSPSSHFGEDVLQLLPAPTTGKMKVTLTQERQQTSGILFLSSDWLILGHVPMPEPITMGRGNMALPLVHLGSPDYPGTRG